MKAYITTQLGDPAGAFAQCGSDPPHRILVMDKDNDILTLYADVLSPGCHVDVAEDGAAGWQALQANTYHLLITEHDLPKLSGVELVRKLRAARMDLPVVMSAGRLPAEDLVRNPSLQLAAMLPKPFSIDKLLKTVKVVLRATESPLAQNHLPPDWQSQPLTERLRL